MRNPSEVRFGGVLLCGAFFGKIRYAKSKKALFVYDLVYDMVYDLVLVPAFAEMDARICGDGYPHLPRCISAFTHEREFSGKRSFAKSAILELRNILYFYDLFYDLFYNLV